MKSVQRNTVRAAVGTAAAAAMLVVGAGGAFAHECYVASRSDRGNQMAGTNSAAWQTVSLDTILTQFIGVPQAVADCVVAAAPQAGVPASFVLGAKQAKGQGGVIAENNPNMSTGLGADGHGIDHAEDAYGAAIGALIGQCSA